MNVSHVRVLEQKLAKDLTEGDLCQILLARLLHVLPQQGGIVISELEYKELLGGLLLLALDRGWPRP